MTVKEQVVQELRANPDGMSRRALQQSIQCNLGTLRRLLARMESVGEITVSVEAREYGDTRVHRLAAGYGRPPEGQTSIEVPGE